MSVTTRDRMLSVTATLLQERGYHGVSLNEILQASAAPRGSLYFHFPGGKDQLVIEATRSTVETITEDLRQRAVTAASTSELVRNAFLSAADALDATGFAFGCPVAPIVLDSPEASEELRQVCRNAFETWIGLLKTKFQDDGRSEAEAFELALLVQSSFEGLLVVAKAYRDAGILRRMAGRMAALLAAPS